MFVVAGAPDDGDDRSDEHERAAILKRRSTFIASALATLTLPVMASSCDPQPCLNVSEPDPTSASSTKGTATETPPDAGAATSTDPPPDAGAPSSLPPPPQDAGVQTEPPKDAGPPTPPQPCLSPVPRPCLKKAPPPPPPPPQVCLDMPPPRSQ